MGKKTIHIDKNIWLTHHGVKLQFKHASNLMWAEDIQNTARKTVDSLNKPYFSSDLLTLDHTTSKGSFSRHWWMDPDFHIAEPDDDLESFENLALVDFDHFTPKNIMRFLPTGKGSDRCEAENRILDISTKITELKQQNAYEVLDAASYIKELLIEFSSLLDVVVQKYREVFEIVFSIYVHKTRIDLRRHIRRVSHFLFKCLPDFSGCDEDASFNSTPSSKPHSSFFQSENLCIPNHYYSTRLIPLSNLRMTG